MGASTAGTSTATNRVSCGLTTNITATAPIRVKRLRSDSDRVVPTRFSMMVMSVVSRDSTSPVRVSRKKAWSSVRTWA